MKFGVGQSPSRTEDARLLRGEGRYTDDVNIAGAAHGFVFRSPLGHAEIVTVLPAGAIRRSSFCPDKRSLLR